MLAQALDKVIGVFNPLGQLQRMQARKLIKRYAGAESNRLTANKSPKNRSADSEMNGPYGADSMRAWARMLVRDNAWAWGVVDTIVSSCVGTGIHVQSMFESPAGEDIETINDARDALWQQWCEVCELNGQYTFQEIQSIALREIVEAGECLIHLVNVPTEYRGLYRPVPLALELIDADRLASDRDSYSLNRSSKIRVHRGVEMNETGQPVAYWIYPDHPTTPYQSVNRQPVRIEARNILHLFRRDRIGQTRGISWFAPVVAWLRDLGVYVDNELQASAVAACFTIAIKTDTPPAGGGGVLASSDMDTQDEDDNQYAFMQPGMIMNLAPHESIESANPGRPNTASEQWIRLMLRGIAVGTGLSYEIVARDYSQTTYSSNRASQLEDRRRFRRIQSLIVNHLNQPVWDRFCDAAALIGADSFPTAADLLTDRRRAAPIVNMPPTWEWVDPQAEQQSSEMGLRAFQTTYQDELGSKGLFWRNVFYQAAKERKLLKTLGLVAEPQAEPPTEPQQPPPTIENSCDCPDCKKKSLARNCGTGAGGFQPGNECAAGGGGGDGAALQHISEEHRASVLQYVSKDYEHIASYLRNGEFDSGGDYDNTVIDIDAAIEEHTLDKPMKTYRGVMNASVHLGNFHVGDTVSDKSFLSTSASEHTAMTYAAGDDGALMEIHLPKGSHALDLRGLNKWGEDAGEFEILLPRNLALKVKEIDETGDVPRYIMEPVGNKGTFDPKDPSIKKALAAEDDN